MTSITTPITTPFGVHSTAAEVVADLDLSGKQAIVTGGASGIGVETARALADAGADVTLAVRNPQAGADIAAEITASTGNAAVRAAQLELTNPPSIYRFVGSWRGPLHILVNNAGVMASPEARTDNGWELQFATNHLGHFALALGLQPALAAAGGARIVAVSSSGHLQSPVVFDDINFRFRPLRPPARLWAVEGRQRLVRCRSNDAVERARHLRKRAQSRRDTDQPPATRRGNGQNPTRAAEEPAAGRSDIRPLGDLAAAGRHWWALLRRLQRGDPRRPSTRRVHRTRDRRRSLCAGPREREAAMGAVTGNGVVMQREPCEQLRVRMQVSRR